MYKIFAVVLFLSVGNVFANQAVVDHVLSVKDRVRLSLWYHGVSLDQRDSHIPAETKSNLSPKLKIELKTALENYDI